MDEYQKPQVGNMNQSNFQTSINLCEDNLNNFNLRQETLAPMTKARQLISVN